MDNRIRSFCASIAGLALTAASSLAPLAPAHAATVTYTDDYCSQFFTIPGPAPGDVLLRCLKMSCSVTTVGTGYTVPNGTTVTLQATCTNPAAQSYAWNVGILSPQGCPAPQPVAGDATKATVMSPTSRICYYEVVAGDTPTPPSTNRGIARFGVAWVDPPPSGCTASVTPSSLPSAGGQVTLTSSCVGGPVTSWTWTRNGTPIPSAQNTTDNLPANSSGSPATYAYAMTACNGISCAAPVPATGSPVTVAAAAVPSGCTITPSPSNASLPASGGNISMAVSCTAGGPFTQFNWRKNLSNFGTNAANQSDTLPPNTSASPVSYTYDVQVCNSAGCAARVSQVFTVAGSVAAGDCSQYANVVQMDLPWPPASDTIYTQTPGGLPYDGVFVGRIVVPANATSASGDGRIQWAEFVDGPGFRTVNISTRACDFRTFGSFNTDPTGATAPLKWSGGTSGDMFYVVAPETPGMSTVAQLQPGQTYFFNLRNVDFLGNPTCPQFGTCNLVLHHTTPR